MTDVVKLEFDETELITFQSSHVEVTKIAIRARTHLY